MKLISNYKRIINGIYPPLLMICLMQLANSNSTAQNFQWANSMGGSFSDQGKGIGLDANGNVYITGSFRSTVDFDPDSGIVNLTSAGVEDIFFAKYNQPAQTYPFPVQDAQWDILVSGFDPFFLRTDIYTYEKDTSLCGFTYSLIVRQNISPVDSMLMRTSGEKIYCKKTADCSSGELLLYDFGLSLGDTFMLAIPQTPYVVTNIDSVTMLNGQKRLFQTLTNQYNSTDSVVLIEGVGHPGHFYWPFTFQPADGPQYEVLCFTDSSGLVYQSTTGMFWNTCDTTYTTIDENFRGISSDLAVHVDYSNDLVVIEFDKVREGARLDIYDLGGRVFLSQELQVPDGNLEFSLHNFSKGMYLCSISNQDERIITKKLIIPK